MRLIRKTIRTVRALQSDRPTVPRLRGSGPPGRYRLIRGAEIVLRFGDTGLLHNGQNSLIEMSLQAINSNGPSVSVMSRGFAQPEEFVPLTD